MVQEWKRRSWFPHFDARFTHVHTFKYLHARMRAFACLFTYICSHTCTHTPFPDQGETRRDKGIRDTWFGSWLLSANGKVSAPVSPSVKWG